jgi:predicted helicase
MVANPSFVIDLVPAMLGHDTYVLMSVTPTDLHFRDAWPMLVPRTVGSRGRSTRYCAGELIQVRPGDVTDAILADCRTRFGQGVTKDDVFFYLYGLAHRQHDLDLGMGLASAVAAVSRVADFQAFAAGGRGLAELHLGYESIRPWPFEPVIDGVRMHPASADYADRVPDDALRVEKMRYVSETDKSMVIVNERLALHAIPPEAHEYRLGPRSAIDWMLERYQVGTDQGSDATNDPNAWGIAHGDPRYVINMLGRLTRLSVESVAIVRAMPKWDGVREQ